MEGYDYKETIVDTFVKPVSGGKMKVSVKLTQKRSKDGIDWEKKELLAEDISTDIGRSLTVCDITIQTYLKGVDNDLFNENNDKANDLKN